MSEERNTYLDDLKDVMSTEQGRRVLYNQVCNVETLSFAGQSNTTIFNEGQRSVSIMLIQDMKAASLDLYFKTMKENTNVN